MVLQIITSVIRPYAQRWALGAASIVVGTVGYLTESYFSNHRERGRQQAESTIEKRVERQLAEGVETDAEKFSSALRANVFKPESILSKNL